MNSFDQETVKKVIKGLMYSFLGGLTAGLMQYQATNDAKGSLLTGVIAMLVPFSANAGAQYKSGVPKE